jgi:hypothetical protein
MTDIPSTWGFGGPSILSDGDYVYSAITVTNTDGDTDIKFSMMNINTMQEKVIYRRDFSIDYPINEDCPVDRETVFSYFPIFIIFGQGTIFFKEYLKEKLAPNYPRTSFEIKKLDFNTGELSTVYSSDILIYPSYFLSSYPLMTVVKSESSGKHFLVFDEQLVNEIRYDYTDWTWGVVYPNNEVAYQQSWHVYRDTPVQIDIYKIDLESEEFISVTTVWQNGYLTNMYDYISYCYYIPSPIFYKDKLYICYRYRNEGLFLTGYPRTVATTCDTVGENPPYPGWIECRSRFVFTENFFGHLFFSIINIDINTDEFEYKEIFNERILSWSFENRNATPYHDGISWLPAEQYPCDKDDMIPYNMPNPYKMVFDQTDELLYIKVGNPDKLSFNPSPTYFDGNPIHCTWVPSSEDIAGQSYGLYVVNVNDFEDYRLDMYADNKEVYDLFMNYDNAYLFQLDSGKNGTMYRLSDKQLVANIGSMYFTPAFGQTPDTWEDYPYGSKLSQQPSTDENIIWKFSPSTDPTDFDLTGYSLNGGGYRKITLPAPFLFDDLFWFNIHQHDGKLILTTGEDTGDSFSQPLVGAWLIR